MSAAGCFFTGLACIGLAGLGWRLWAHPKQWSEPGYVARAEILLVFLALFGVAGIYRAVSLWL